MKSKQKCQTCGVQPSSKKIKKPDPDEIKMKVSSSHSRFNVLLQALNPDSTKNRLVMKYKRKMPAGQKNHVTYALFNSMGLYVSKFKASTRDGAETKDGKPRDTFLSTHTEAQAKALTKIGKLSVHDKKKGHHSTIFLADTDKEGLVSSNQGCPECKRYFIDKDLIETMGYVEDYTGGNDAHQFKNDVKGLFKSRKSELDTSFEAPSETDSKADIELYVIDDEALQGKDEKDLKNGLEASTLEDYIASIKLTPLENNRAKTLAAPEIMGTIIDLNDITVEEKTKTKTKK